jgi:hypothetical protein
MKALKWIAWISAVIGVLFLILVPVSLFFNGGNAVIGLHIANFFTAASSFFLLTIMLFIFLYRCECKK